MRPRSLPEQRFSGEQLDDAVDYFESIGFPRSYAQPTLETMLNNGKGPKVLRRR